MSFLSSFTKKGKELFNSSKATVTQTNEKPLPLPPKSIPNLGNLNQIQVDTYNEARFAIAMIERFIAQLKTELDERSKKFGKKFLRLFPNTKIDKIDELDKLIRNIQQKIDDNASRGDLKQSDWHLLVSEAMHNKKIKRTFILEPRALNVLQNILDGRARRGILDPKDKKEDKEWLRPSVTNRWW